jgi:hypothetical protein
MSQNLNPEAVSDGREFAGHVKPSEPLMTGGVSLPISLQIHTSSMVLLSSCLNANNHPPLRYLQNIVIELY